MVKETTPTREKSDTTETDVILVVKGAGEQEEDVHLNLFLRGFWPAIKTLDADATIAQIKDETGDDSSSPHNEKEGSHKHLTEIHAQLKNTNRRIWIKESYWEYEVLPSTALGNLSKEWQLSSHVFVNMFQDIFFTRDSKRVRKFREEIQTIDHPKPGTLDRVGNYISYFLLFLLLLTPLGIATIFGGSLFKDAVINLFTPAFIDAMREFKGFYGFVFAIIIAAIWAIAPAYEISKMVPLRDEIALRKLPGLPTWTLIFLILLLLTNPIGYISLLFLLLILQIGQLLSRRLLWKYRKYANSDVDRSTYYPYKQMRTKKLLVGKVQEGPFTRLAFSPLIYRYFIFLALPAAFVITILANVLKWTKILRDFGKTLDEFVKFLLVGYLDDVVNYATDPAQAERVRSVIMEDIKHFHELKKDNEIQRIHIVAHSQGTPITFETLFQYIEPKYQKKIHTYVTLGSVLSYYHQARGILDLAYYNRFNMPIRTDKFPAGFKWMNFWNFTDPITEFYGLDEYAWFKDDWAEVPETKERLPRRGYTSPVNIRTHSSVLKNHGEYWDNLDNFQIPFAKRVLGEDKPVEWNPDDVGKKNWHHLAVLLLWPVMILLMVGVSYGIFWLAQNFLAGYLDQIIVGSKNLQANLFPPKPDAEPGLLTKLFDPVTMATLKTTWREFLSLSLVLLTVWAAFDWIGQLRRAFLFGRK